MNQDLPVGTSIQGAKQKHSRWLRGLDDGINGIAVEALPNGKQYIAVYVRKITPSVRRVVPPKVDGYPIRLVEVGEISAQ